jgi:hypothetical protein
VTGGPIPAPLSRRPPRERPKIGPRPAGRACGLVSSRQPPRRRGSGPGPNQQRTRLARRVRHVMRSQAHTPAGSANYPHQVARASVDSTARPGGNGAATTAAATGRGCSRSRPRRRHTSGSTGTPAPPPAGGMQRRPGLPPGRPAEAHTAPGTRPRQSPAHCHACRCRARESRRSGGRRRGRAGQWRRNAGRPRPDRPVGRCPRPPPCTRRPEPRSRQGVRPLVVIGPGHAKPSSRPPGMAQVLPL